jgi:hypothetical protein
MDIKKARNQTRTKNRVAEVSRNIDPADTADSETLGQLDFFPPCANLAQRSESFQHQPGIEII